MTSEAESTPITIIISRDENKPKKRLNILIDEDLADVITQFAQLNSIPKGELIEKMADSFFSAPCGIGKWRLRKP
jgi:hypothetical protein